MKDVCGAASTPKALGRSAAAQNIVQTKLKGANHNAADASTLGVLDVHEAKYSFVAKLSLPVFKTLGGLFDQVIELGAGADIHESENLDIGAGWAVHQFENHHELLRHLPKGFRNPIICNIVHESQCWAMRTGDGAAVQAHVDMLNRDDDIQVPQYALLLMIHGAKLAITMTSPQSWVSFFGQNQINRKSNEFGHPDLKFLLDKWADFKDSGGHAFHLEEGHMLLIPAGHPHYVVCLDTQGDSLTVGWDGPRFGESFWR